MKEILDNPIYMNYLFCGLYVLGGLLIFALIYRLLTPKVTSVKYKAKLINYKYNKLILERINTCIEEYPNMKFGEILLNLGVVQTGVNKTGIKYTINPSKIPSKTMYNYLKYVKLDSDLSENDD